MGQVTVGRNVRNFRVFEVTISNGLRISLVFRCWTGKVKVVACWEVTIVFINWTFRTKSLWNASKVVVCIRVFPFRRKEGVRTRNRVEVVDFGLVDWLSGKGSDTFIIKAGVVKGVCMNT